MNIYEDLYQQENTENLYSFSKEKLWLFIFSALKLP